MVYAIPHQQQHLVNFYTPATKIQNENEQQYMQEFQKLKLYDQHSREETEEDIGSRFKYVGEDCQPASSWQTTSRPTCNMIHEIDLLNFESESNIRSVYYSDTSDRVFYLGKGHHRNVWEVQKRGKAQSSSSSFVLKTLRIDRNFTEAGLEMHRIDALGMDELTHSPNVVDIYGYCAQSAMNEIGVGDLHKAEKIFEGKNRQRKRKSKYTDLKKLELAVNVASSVADLQEIDKEKGPLMVHRDIGPANMLVMSDGRVKLNDFNSARMIYGNHHGLCGYHDEFLCGQDSRRADTRSPEECLGDVLSEKVDTYAIGTILFFLLTGERAYHYHKDDLKIAFDNDLVRAAIRNGKGPRLPSSIEDTNDPAIVALRTAMRQALTHDPVKRPSARKIAEYLKLALSTIHLQQ